MTGVQGQVTAFLSGCGEYKGTREGQDLVNSISAQQEQTKIKDEKKIVYLEFDSWKVLIWDQRKNINELHLQKGAKKLVFCDESSK